MKITHTMLTATGKVRPNNEDSLACLAESGVFAVADGMGGGEEGERASRMVCEALKAGVAASDFRERTDEVGRAVEAANRDILAYARERGFRQMGSTLALLAVDREGGGRGIVGHVGDSRVYRLRVGAAELLTRDHSVAAELAARVGGEAGAKLVRRTNPLAHVLTRAIGTSERAMIDWRKVDVLPGDRFLVCTDGVHDVVETEALPALAGGGTVDAAAHRLEEAVLDAGAPDNYSFILLEIGT